jgi:hypothetical protein
MPRLFRALVPDENGQETDEPDRVLDSATSEGAQCGDASGLPDGAREPTAGWLEPLNAEVTRCDEDSQGAHDLGGAARYRTAGSAKNGP